MGAIIVRTFRLFLRPVFFLKLLHPHLIDWHLHWRRLDLQDLQRIRVVGRKICPSRIHSAPDLQGDDVQRRDPKDRYRSRLPRKHLPSLSGTSRAFSYRILYARVDQTTSSRLISSWRLAHPCGKRTISASSFRTRLKSCPTWSEHSSTLTTKRLILP